MDDVLTIYMIKTNKGCFISNCKETSGYNWNYHESKVKGLYFDGKLPEKSYLENWYYIPQYPQKIEKREFDKSINKRFELIDPELESKKMPLKLSCNELAEEDSRRDLYRFKCDIQKGELVEIDVNIEIICEVENFEFPPKIKYEGIEKMNFKDCKTTITNVDIKHQMLDKIMIPEIMLHNYPCEMTSDELYKIVRQYIRKNIDNNYARIVSDYDFCFEVDKLIPTRKPNGEAGGYREIKIFKMTDEGHRYKGYTPIPSISANNEKELKDKIDSFLNGLISYINEPLVKCEYCNGFGYVNVGGEYKFEREI
jgi:hypothetical protein